MVLVAVVIFHPTFSQELVHLFTYIRLEQTSFTFCVELSLNVLDKIPFQHKNSPWNNDSSSHVSGNSDIQTSNQKSQKP